MVRASEAYERIIPNWDMDMRQNGVEMRSYFDHDEKKSCCINNGG